MQIHRVVSGGRAARAQWWEEQTERVLEEAGFAPYISELFITDRSGELELVRALPEPMTSVALAVPAVAPQVPLVLDVAECLRLISPGGIGRLAYVGRFGLTVIPVNYGLHEGAIMFRTAQDSPTGEALQTGIAHAEYKVAFDMKNEGGGGRSFVPAKYTKYETANLTASVKSGGEPLKFELK